MRSWEMSSFSRKLSWCLPQQCFNYGSIPAPGFFMWIWVLNPGTCVCGARLLLMEPSPQTYCWVVGLITLCILGGRPLSDTCKYFLQVYAYFIVLTYLYLCQYLYLNIHHLFSPLGLCVCQIQNLLCPRDRRQTHELILKKCLSHAHFDFENEGLEEWLSN